MAHHLKSAWFRRDRSGIEKHQRPGQNVVMHNVVSVDGFIADENDQVGPLFEWYVNGEYGLAEDRQDATGR